LSRSTFRRYIKRETGGRPGGRLAAIALAQGGEAMAVRQSARAGLSLILVLLAALASVPAVVRAAPAPLPAAIYFPETGQTIRGPFLRFWAERGQARLFGLPITPELIEHGRTVQYFEQARFELAPAIGTDEVQLGLLGREAVADWTPAAFDPVAPGQQGPDRRYFEATGHSLAFAFKRFWEANGGLMIFGAPISEEFDLDGRTVQYFERARFEYVPERAATGAGVYLAALGRAVAQGRGLSLAPASPPPLEAVPWTPALQQVLLERQQQARQATALETVMPVEPFQVAIGVPAADTYWAPLTSARDAGPVFGGHIFLIDGIATGEPVDGDSRWYRLALDGSFIPAAHVAPFAPPPPPRTWPGRWIDVNLSTFYLTVYDGEQPLRSALITAGRKGRTPTGVFSVQRRVRSETMDSATVGIPKGHAEYYYLRNVEYTQYFTGAGHAIHGNYWVHPSRFGQFISNGCIGLRNNDAAWVWSLTTHGTPIHIHF
jgi:hypothetical protein